MRPIRYLILAMPLVLSTACAGRSRPSPLGVSANHRSASAVAVDLESVHPVAYYQDAGGDSSGTDGDGEGDKENDEPATKNQDVQPWDAEADPSDFATLTLADAITTALANNPTIAQSAAAIGRVRGQRAQVGFYPNPTLGYVASNLGDSQTAGEHGVFMSQTWVTAGKLQWNRAVAAGDLAAARAIHDAQCLHVSAGVTARFYQALAAQRQVEAALELERVADEGLRITERRFEGGETTRGDLLQAEVVLNRAGISAARSGIEAHAAWRRLAAAIGRPDWQPRNLDGDLGPPEELEDLDEVDIEPLWSHVQSHSPELQAAAALVARTEARIAREHAEAVPNIDFQTQVQHDFANDQVLGSFQMGVPLPVRHRNQGAIAAAHAQHQRALANYRRLELDLRDRLAVAVGQAETAGRRVETYRDEIVPKAKESLSLIQQQYDVGETELLRLLTAQESYAAARLDLITFQSDWRLAWATLDGLLLGDPLDAPPDAPSPGNGAGFTGVSRAE